MTPERFTPNDIKTLVLSEGPAITLVLAANDNGDQRIHLKGEIASLREQAQADGANGAANVKDLLDSIELPAGNHTGAMAFLRSSSVSFSLPVSADVKPVSRVSEGFDLRTLLAISNSQKRFYVVALSLNHARLLECTEKACTEVAFPADTATSLDGFLAFKQPDHDQENRHSGGPSMGSMKGVLFGTSADKEKQDEYRLHFFKSVDRAVHAALRGQNVPLIPVGVEHELALYGTINTYPHLIQPGVYGSAEALDGRELHTRALEVLANDPQTPHKTLLADYEKRIGTGHASGHIQAIVTAAHEGRVSHLFFQQDAHYDGTFDESRQKIKHHTDSLDATVDLVDEAARQTLLHGGEVFLLSAREMPKGIPMCALFRYAAAEAPVTESVMTGTSTGVA